MIQHQTIGMRGGIRNAQKQSFTPRKKATSLRHHIASSLFAILGLSSSAHAQDTILEKTTHMENRVGTKLCNKGYVESRKALYEVTALHCKTGATGRSAIDKDDITYTRIPSLPIGERAMKILDAKMSDLQNVTVQLCVYNLDGDIGKNRYCRPFSGTARFDSTRGMYYMEIPKEVKVWYSENVASFEQHRMKSASGSPVEWQGKFVGTVSSVKYNTSSSQKIQGFDPFEARFYIAPGKWKIS